VNIPEEKIAEVKERAGIVEVVSDYLSLKKSGANYQGLCPFHGEKTPSFSVNQARGFFHCFGCGENGNVITFVMKMEGLSFPEAVKLLARRVGVVIEDRPLTIVEKKNLDEKEQMLAIISQAAAYYSRLLLQDASAESGRRYLAGRKVEKEIFDAYRLGYASERWDGLAQFLKQQGASLEQVEKLGLIRKKSSGSGYYDLFRNRLIFTIANVHGQPIGFGGRVLDDSLPKYINSPESPVYSKSEVLFGIDLARQAMRERRAAIIVEGYFDHLGLYKAGIRNVVATCGTALTSGHIQLLKRYAEKVYLLFDGDSAGKKATFRAMELLLPEQMPVFVIEMPSGDDPDSFLASHTVADFEELLAKARPVLDYFLRDLLSGQDTGSVAGKKGVIDRFRPMVQKLADPLERDLYMRELARILAVDVRTLGSVNEGGRGKPIVAVADMPAAGAGESLVALLWRYPEVAPEFKRQDLHMLLPKALLPLVERLLLLAESGAQGEWSELLSSVDGTELQQKLASLVMDDSHLADIDPVRAFNDYCLMLQRQSLQNSDAKALRRELLQLDSDSARYWEIMEELNTLRSRKSQLT
jgi:DNA primase